MNWFRNFLISVGAYLLSYWLVFLFAWPIYEVTNRITYGDSIVEIIARGIMTSMPRAICAGIGAAIVMFFVNSAKPQRWAWCVALLYAVFGPNMHWYRTLTFRDRLWQGVDWLCPVVVCVAVAAIIARRRRNEGMVRNGEPHSRWRHILWATGPRPFVLVRNLWVLSSLATLVVSLVRYPNDNFSSALIMWALSFPSGFLVVIIHNYMDAVLTDRSECVFVWLMFFVAGYAQWFILIPALRGRFKIPADSSTGQASDDATEKTT